MPEELQRLLRWLPWGCALSVQSSWDATQPKGRSPPKVRPSPMGRRRTCFRRLGVGDRLGLASARSTGRHGVAKTGRMEAEAGCCCRLWATGSDAADAGGWIDPMRDLVAFTPSGVHPGPDPKS